MRTLPLITVSTSFILITGLIWLPVVLHPGQLFLLDNVFGYHIQLSDYTHPALQTDLPFSWLFWLISAILPIGLVQKLVYWLLYLGLSGSAYLFSRRFMPPFWAGLAGLIYLLNPFVFERTLAGHWLVLLGFMFCPLVLWSWHCYLTQPGRLQLIQFTILFALFPLASLHVWYMSLPALALMAIIVWVSRWPKPAPEQLSHPQIWNRIKDFHPSRQQTIQSITAIGCIAFTWLIINSFWLIPLLRSQGPTHLNAISLADFKAFSLTIDPRGGPWLTALALYGFWGGGYRLPKDIQSLWWMPGVVTAVLSITGLMWLRRQKPALAWSLLAAGIVGLVISVGITSPLTRPLTSWLYRWLPGFSGLRDSSKALGWLSLAYAIGASFAGMNLSDWLHRTFELPRAVTRFALVLLVVSIPAATLPGMVAGFNGQIVNTSYPTNWQRAQDLLNHDHAATILVLPWHGYLSFPFTQNHIIANPAKVYFDQPVISAQTLDNQYLDKNVSPWDKTIQRWLDHQSLSETDIRALQAAHVSHLVLLKTVDWANYQFLGRQNNLRAVFDSSDLIIFKVM